MNISLPPCCSMAGRGRAWNGTQYIHCGNCVTTLFLKSPMNYIWPKCWAWVKQHQFHTRCNQSHPSSHITSFFTVFEEIDSSVVCDNVLAFAHTRVQSDVKCTQRVSTRQSTVSRFQTWSHQTCRWTNLQPKSKPILSHTAKLKLWVCQN